MNEKKFDIYFEFSYSGLNLAAFSKTSSKLEYYKEQTYKSYFNNYKELNFEIEIGFFLLYSFSQPRKNASN